MPKVRIIDIPPGQAPEWVRKEWVGLEFPIAESLPSSEFVQIGVKFGEPENIGGYQIETRTAIEILEKKSPEAAEWWKSNIHPELMPRLVFKKEVCEFV